MKDKLINVAISFICAIIILFLLCCFVDIDIFSHSPYDTYTRQAIAWLDGKNYLDVEPSSVAYLELAQFDGKIFVSFPPVPTIIEVVLALFFGAQTPDRLLLFIYSLISVCALTLAFLRKHPFYTSVLYALFATVATNMLEGIAFGGVWHEAQLLSFALCSCAVALIGSKNNVLKGCSLFLVALAVGCRPFTVIFIPFLLFELFKQIEADDLKCKIKKFSLYLIAPAVVAILLMAYNFARFGNVFEFGHNYLPEFLNSQNGQFSFEYLFQNLKNALRIPLQINNGKISVVFDQFGSNNFFIVNPIILVFLIYVIKDLFKKENRVEAIFWFFAVVAFTIVTCMHKTLGGWQFGCRYFIDIIPFLAFYLSKRKLYFGVPEILICIFGIALNLYGATLV